VRALSNAWNRKTAWNGADQLSYPIGFTGRVQGQLMGLRQSIDFADVLGQAKVNARFPRM
jgi:hypothetical protein